MNLTSVEGIGPVTERKLVDAGVTSVAQLAGADAAALSAATGVAETRIAAFIDRAKNPEQPTPTGTETVKLLAGGNPQIPKGDGDAPVEAYLEAMPGWKRDVGRRLNDLVEEVVPEVRKAVRWNSPFYGREGHGWFLSFHCITKYVKVSFFKGTELDPVPPVESKRAGIRYVHLYEDGGVDDDLMRNWIEQASNLPGEALF